MAMKTYWVWFCRCRWRSRASSGRHRRGLQSGGHWPTRACRMRRPHRGRRCRYGSGQL